MQIKLNLHLCWPVLVHIVPRSASLIHCDVYIQLHHVICLVHKLNGLKIAWAAKCAGCKVSKPTQSVRAHAKCADPRKAHRATQSARATLWVRRTPTLPWACVHWTSQCAILSALAAIAWRGEWAALSTHLPRTCHAMPTQCNRGSTRVGRDEPQSPGTLRVKWWIFK